MLILILLTLFNFGWSQELELNTKNIHAYAQIKNCIDFSMCAPYEETLKKDENIYRWRVKFNESISKITKAMHECRVEHSDYTMILRDENGLVLKDFTINYGKKINDFQRRYFPMEPSFEAFQSLKLKEPSIDSLLRNTEPLTAMKSTVFEFEYPLGEYKLTAERLRPNVLGRTHHNLKVVTYDLEKWDGKVCRFYQVMRHEVQHVKNYREIQSCKGRHQFVKGNNDDISVYVNDLSFIKKYCPDDADLYNNVEQVLFAMYEGKKIDSGCSEGGSHQTGGESGNPNSPTAKGEGKDKVKIYGNLTPAQSKKIGELLEHLKQKGLLKKSYPTWERKPAKKDTFTGNPDLR